MRVGQPKGWFNPPEVVRTPRGSRQTQDGREDLNSQLQEINSLSCEGNTPPVQAQLVNIGGRSQGEGLLGPWLSQCPDQKVLPSTRLSVEENPSRKTAHQRDHKASGAEGTRSGGSEAESGRTAAAYLLSRSGGGRSPSHPRLPGPLKGGGLILNLEGTTSLGPVPPDLWPREEA